MCVYSNVLDFAGKIPAETWTPDLYTQFQELLGRVQEIDRKLNQPDCEDPAKTAWIKDVEARLQVLEEKEGLVAGTHEVFLLGSSLLPAMIYIGGKEVQLGDVVNRAFKDSGLTKKQWNDLPELTREAHLAKAVYAMRAEVQIVDLRPVLDGITFDADCVKFDPDFGYLK